MPKSTQKATANPIFQYLRFPGTTEIVVMTSLCGEEFIFVLVFALLCFALVVELFSFSLLLGLFNVFFFNLFLLIGREISNEVGSLEIHCMFTLPTLVFEYKQLKKKKRMQGNCSTNTDALIPHQQHVSKCGIQLNNCFLRNCICMVICSIPIWCHIIPCGFPLTQNIKSRTRHELGQTPVHREACLLEKASVRYGQGC